MDYKPNSKRSKEGSPKPVPDKKFEKVITGEAKFKKRNNFLNAFLPEDMGSIKTAIFLDVFIPALKKALSDMWNMILYPNGEEGGYGRRNSPASKVSYMKYWQRDRDDDRRYPLNYRSNCLNCDEIIVDTRGEAEDILATADEIICSYGIISVACLYDLAGRVGNHTDNKYGWTDVSGAKIIRLNDGSFMIKMPKALPLD